MSTSRPACDEQPGPVARVLALLVRGYQLVISPWIAPRCRFYPSCSAYAVTALRRHGALRGSWLAARRLGRCHPWNPGGVDHVPSKAPRATTTDLPSSVAAADDPSADGPATAA
jgi:putative membrane protein insertion efficiency factor